MQRGDRQCDGRGDRMYGESKHETGDAKRRHAEQRNKTGSADSIQEGLSMETKSVEK